MTSGRWRVIFAAYLFLSMPCYAPADKHDQAAEWIARGIAAYKNGDYTKAIEYSEQALHWKKSRNRASSNLESTPTAN